MMRKKYVRPDMEITEFEEIDVLTSSSDAPTPEEDDLDVPGAGN